MSAPVFTGSRARPSLPLLRWIESPVVFVEPHELETYRAEHPHLEHVPLPDSGRGFSYMQNRLLDSAANCGFDYYWFVDDDVYGLKARANVAELFVRVSYNDALRMLALAEATARAHKFAMFGISFAGHAWSATRGVQENVSPWGFYLLKTEAVQKVGGWDPDLIVAADYELGARLVKHGHRVGRTNLVAFEHKMNSMAGGASDLYQNRKAEIKEAMTKLHARYPECSRVLYHEGHDLHEIRFNLKLVRRASSILRREHGKT